MLTRIPGDLGPPWAIMPLYMIVSHSSPVRTWKQRWNFTLSDYSVINVIVAWNSGWCTWKTLMRACGKLSKLLRWIALSGKLNLPPNTCIPSRAKMTMKRKRSRSREAMDFTEFRRDTTKLLRDVQYLESNEMKYLNGGSWCFMYGRSFIIEKKKIILINKIFRCIN